MLCMCVCVLESHEIGMPFASLLKRFLLFLVVRYFSFEVNYVDLNTVVMQLILWLLMVAYGMVEIALCSECNERCGKNIDKTVIDSNVERFHRILRRKKRFLLFPPGSALVVSRTFVHFQQEARR